MNNLTKGLGVLIVALVAFFTLGASGQILKMTDAGQVQQVSVLTTSETATYENQSGAFETMPSTSLTMDLKDDSLLVITFNARGTVRGPTLPATQIPIVFIKCQIDGTPCQPNFNSVEFLYPQYCCDTRSFTWAVDNAKKGTHNISILWGMGNPTSAFITNRALVVEAAAKTPTASPTNKVLGFELVLAIAALSAIYLLERKRR